MNISQLQNKGSWFKAMLVALTVTSSLSVEASALLSDDFNSDTTEPNPTWILYDPYDGKEGDSTLTVEGGNALINIPAGKQHDLFLPISKNKAPRFLQPAPNSDFKFEVKFETVPSSDTQMQGIIIQEDNNNFLRFDVYRDNSGKVYLYIAYINADTSVENSAVQAHTEGKGIELTTSPKYRQVIREVVGNKWTFRYSDNGVDWTEVTFTQELVVSDVGFYAGTAGNNPSFLSSVDYFIDLDLDDTPAVALNGNPVNDSDTWTPPVSNPPVITTWYDTDSTIDFGSAGITQKWANILGNVDFGTNLMLSYKINDEEEFKALTYGSNTEFRFRLENKGDFNIEIDRTSLIVGPNTVEIKAYDGVNPEIIKTVVINYAPANIGIPTSTSPYTVDWNALSENIRNVENIAHIVDGKWILTDDGIRTEEDEEGYDRAIAIGDVSWPSNNYEVTVPFIPHTNFSGIGFAVGWQGHEVDPIKEAQPILGWPAQALAWIRGGTSSQAPRLEVLAYKADRSSNPDPGWENVLSGMDIQPFELNQSYMLKSYTKPLNNGMSEFHVKLWKATEAEPTAWAINAEVATRDGSILLVAYDGNTTFGNITVMPAANDSGDTTAPILGPINVTTSTSTATITWTTNEPANSVVNYGDDSGYGINVSQGTKVINHSITLSDLNPNTEYHYQVVSTDGSSNTAKSNDLTFTTVPSTQHVLPSNQWHQISLPMTPPVGSDTVADIFGDDNLGAYGSDWILFRYDTSSNAYEKLEADEALAQGMGYWMIQMSGSDKTLDMPAGSSAISTMVIPLGTRSGTNQWNMIGYPFDIEGNLINSRIVTTTGTCSDGCTLDKAKEENIFENKIWAYDAVAEEYVSTPTLNPWQGFWVVTLDKADGKAPTFSITQ